MNKEIINATKTQNLTYLEALQALKRGESVQVLVYENIGWENLNTDEVIGTLLNDEVKFRIKPTKREVIVNGKKFYSENIEIELDTEYFVPNLANEDYYQNVYWNNDGYDNRALERGLIFLNKEDAIGYAKAVLCIED